MSNTIETRCIVKYIPPVVDKHIARERWLGVIGFHACPETRGCCFDVPISVVDADHDGSLIFDYVHNDLSLYF